MSGKINDFSRMHLTINHIRLPTDCHPVEHRVFISLFAPHQINFRVCRARRCFIKKINNSKASEWKENEEEERERE